jgi:formamidopyrimidine-DNA glycosylase
MPELPEVETTKNGIKDAITGQRIKQVIIRHHQLRWPIPKQLPEVITNQKLLGVKRRAKYILLEFENGTLIMHLGMSGNLRILDQKTGLKKHDHVDIIFANDIVLRYNDPRRFGCILWCEEDIEQHRLINHLGPEPLESVFSSNYLQKTCQKKKIAIKQAIMDAKIVVGVGNIYASEALFLSGIHPLNPANSLDKEACSQLCKQIKFVLRKSIKAGGTTLKDFSRADGKPGYFKQQLNVYGQDGQPCQICYHAIEKITLGGRSTFYCPQCQKK